MTTRAATAHLRTGIPVLAWALGLTALMRLATLGLYPLAHTTELRYSGIARKTVNFGDWSPHHKLPSSSTSLKPTIRQSLLQQSQDAFEPSGSPTLAVADEDR